MKTSNFYISNQTVEGRLLPIYKSKILTAPHGFSSRAGGFSTLPHLSTLNMGYDIGDTNETVNDNRSIFASAALEQPVSHDRIISARQIHSTTVSYVNENDIGRSDFALDGFVTDKKGVPLFIKTADCCPLLFLDPEAGVIGAAHAGWRGTVNGIAAETVKVMCKHGATEKNIRCAIGPCIHECCFEVGDDFVETVRTILPPALFASCVKKWQDGKYHADLPAINEFFLLECGLSVDQIDAADHCTCCRPDIFFSHRATQGKRGLMGAIIML